MPTTWNRTPEEFHKIYISNTDSFYKAAGKSFAPEVDAFMTECAFQIWSRSAAVTQAQTDLANELYSRGQDRPSWLLWTLTEKVCGVGEFLPPLFFWTLAEDDARLGTDDSRLFIRVVTNILLYLAASDYEITYEEAERITEITDKLSAICDSSNVKKSESGINPLDYVTSNEPSFIEKNGNAQAPVTEKAAATESSAEQDTEEAEKPSLEECMAELDELIGLEEIKKDVKSLMNLVKVRKLRTENELPVPDMSLHMVFLGNPGTGKTTIARLISKLYASIGALSKGQLIEVDRSGLVAGYVGQTALKTQEVIQSALGGVLFIDEAYSLASGGENDYGREAIETILKAMEDHRDDLVVIVAGYDEPMEKFLSSNPGLKSRFNKYFHFPDYTGEELMAIFKLRCDKNGYTLSEDAEKAATEMFNELYENRSENFGNGRDVRNIFEDMVTRQSNRIAGMENPAKDDLMTVLPCDLVESDESAEPDESSESSPETSEEKSDEDSSEI